jgi:UDP-glucose 4-epimerase
MDDPHKHSVLVTGGRGFIGRSVVKLLQRKGYDVVSLDLSPPLDAPASGALAPREVVCDIGDSAQLRRVFETARIQSIIHLAAILPTMALRDPLLATRVNVIGSLHLMELARQFGVRRVIFGSSVSVYGTCPFDKVVREEDPAAPEDLYGAAKLYVEQLGNACKQPEFASLRIARVVGTGAQSRTSAWRSEIFEKLGTKQPAKIELPYRGSERLLILHVDDLAKMLLALLQASTLRHSTYNAPCESIVVDDLKMQIEELNSIIHMALGEAAVAGNPRLLDCSRFADEFEFQSASIAGRLKQVIQRADIVL